MSAPGHRHPRQAVPFSVRHHVLALAITLGVLTAVGVGTGAVLGTLASHVVDRLLDVLVGAP